MKVQIRLLVLVFIFFTPYSLFATKQERKISSEDFIYQLDFAGGNTGDSVTDFYSSPSQSSIFPMAQRLINQINIAQKSIDFALYGVRNQCAFIDALKNAQLRGVIVRGIIDQNSNDSYDYSDHNQCDTKALVDSLGSNWVKNDVNPNTGKAYSYIMHNKFFIFDKDTVSVGSTNISDSGVGGEYNANWMIHINSENLANTYTIEFEEMWVQRLTHKKKTDNTPHHMPKYTDNTEVYSYFSPTDDAMNRAIIPTINSAHSELKVSIFFLTHPQIAQAILDAHQRGVEVRVIIDALGAANNYSTHKLLCDNQIKVKIENWNGKMHMKALVADNQQIIIGSQNFTKASNNENDENTLRILGPGAQKIAAEFNVYFEHLWDSIPNRFVCFNPRAESIYSNNTCADGIDNDFDEQVDSQDTGCMMQPILKNLIK